MQLTRSFIAASLSFSLVFVSFISFASQKVSAQDSKIALQRGYRTGYSDGYLAGNRDSADNASREYARHGEYEKADRAFNKDYGRLEDYRDGYQQGFESGYDAGFDRRSFDPAIPLELKQRGVRATTRNNEPQTNTAPPNYETRSQQPPVMTQRPEIVSPPSGEQTISIPADTELIVELLGDINTKQSKVGDKFQARVIAPYEISGAIVEGRIEKIQKPGRIKKRAELSLRFDQIRLSERRWSNFNATLAEVLPYKGDNVRRVDAEGVVEGRSSTKDDSIKVGATTGTGLVIGAVAGGPVGAAVGAGVGAAFGVGAVIIERGKDIKLIQGQQLRVKTAYETQIR